MGDDDDDGDDAFGEGKGRSTRGLRVLSLKGQGDCRSEEENLLQGCRRVPDL